MTFYPPDGGVSRHVLDVLGGIDPAAWEVHAACVPGGDAWEALRERPGVRLHGLVGTHGPPRPRDLLDGPRLARLVSGAAVVHAHSAKAGFLTRLAAAAQGAGGKVVFTPHAWSFWAARGAEKRLYLALERAAAGWCRTIVAVSEHEREAGLAVGIGSRQQYRVIPNGVELRPYSLPRDVRPGRTLFVGRLSDQKRPDLAIRALALVRQERREATLDLAGDGPWRDRVEGLIASEGLAGAVRLLGPRTDVAALLSQSACLLLTSDYEGCPFSVLEAMAAGVPVVATRVGGVEELVVDGETGLLVDPGRPAALAGALGSLLADPVRAAALGAAGRRRAQAHFTRERMVQDTLSLYQSISRG